MGSSVQRTPLERCLRWRTADQRGRGERPRLRRAPRLRGGGSGVGPCTETSIALCRAGSASSRATRPKQRAFTTSDL